MTQLTAPERMFERFDCVTLITGGPVLLVNNVVNSPRGDYIVIAVQVYWFSKTDELQEKWIDQDLLVIYEKDIDKPKS